MFIPVDLLLSNHSYSINNDKGSTIKLTDEIKNTNGILGERSDYELENRIEQAIPEDIPADRCVIM